MNTDDLERQLQRQRLRPIPPAWRADILRAARQAMASGDDAADEHPVPWWRAWLWPSPEAWAGLAVVWVLILGLNYFARGPMPEPVAGTSPARPRSSLRLALAAQRQLEAELLGLEARREEAPVEPPSASSPRSERRARERPGVAWQTSTRFAWT